MPAGHWGRCACSMRSVAFGLENGHVRSGLSSATLTVRYNGKNGIGIGVNVRESREGVNAERSASRCQRTARLGNGWCSRRPSHQPHMDVTARPSVAPGP